MASRVQILLFLVTLCCMQYKINGHVALTFPPARKYDLDFLDNSRTPAPCGMPKGECLFYIPIDIFIKSLKTYTQTMLLS
jgi:hypothetical protein